MLSRAVVVFLVFGFFGGPKLGIYMYRDASTKTLFEIRAARNTFELSFFLFPLLLDIAYVVVVAAVVGPPLFPRLDVLFKTLDVALQPLDGGLERLNRVRRISWMFDAVCFAQHLLEG
jgi:hypothetical protein